MYVVQHQGINPGGDADIFVIKIQVVAVIHFKKVIYIAAV